MRFTGTIILLSAFFSSVLMGNSFAQEAEPEFSKKDILYGLADDPFARTHDLTPNNTLQYSFKLGTHRDERKPPWVYRWLSELSRQKDLKEDTEIQKALLNLVDHHPLMSVRNKAAQYLPQNHEKFQEPSLFASREKPSDELFCRPGSLGATTLTIADDLREKLAPKWSFTNISVEGVTQKTAPIQRDTTPDHLRIKTTAQSVSGGWIVGYDRGLGLHFVSEDDSKPTKKLLPGSYNYISPLDTQGYMWLITDGAWGCNSSSIYRVRELSTGKFDIGLFRVLGGSIRNVLALPNGDLFMDMGSNRRGGGQCGLYSLNQSPRAAYTMPIGGGFNHPPIGLTPEGGTYRICEANAPKF